MSNIKLNARLRAYSNASIELPALAVDDTLSETSTNPVQNKVITLALSEKVDKEVGKTLTSNDFTNELKDKLDNIEVGANKTIIDTELSDTSNNPVENKVISVALGDKVTIPNTNGVISVQDKQISTVEPLSVEDTKSLFGSVCDSLMSRKTSMPSREVQ